MLYFLFLISLLLCFMVLTIFFKIFEHITKSKVSAKLHYLRLGVQFSWESACLACTDARIQRLIPGCGAVSLQCQHWEQGGRRIWRFVLGPTVSLNPVCTMRSCFKNKQKPLLLELMYRFYWLIAVRYETHFSACLDDIQFYTEFWTWQFLHCICVYSFSLSLFLSFFLMSSFVSSGVLIKGLIPCFLVNVDICLADI